MEQSHAHGYLGRPYIDALGEFGRPLELPASQGWLLARALPGHPGIEDACGAYPLFCCRDWRRLHEDLDNLESGPVSCVLVTDPFGDYTSDDLNRAFPDLLRSFKQHITVELDVPLESFVDSHHRYYARKALRDYQVSLCAQPLSLLDRWNELYYGLVQRHGINGMAAFSADSFRRQFGIPGVRVFAAERDGVVEGMQIWFAQDRVAYHHLGAYSVPGYRSSVSYALMWSALQWFAAAGTQRVDLGAGAGLQQSNDGLTFFKRGWGNATAPVLLCGRVLDRSRYERLSAGLPGGEQAFFPRYRMPAVADRACV